MKNYIIYLFSFIVLLFTSCSLDDQPTDSIEPSKAFRNLSDINMGLMGAYAVLGDDFIVTSTIVSDEVKLPEENTVSNTSLHRWLYDSGSGSVTSSFYMLYRVIDRANRVLENIDKIEYSSNELALKDQYYGELLALRAYAHFELLRNYGSGYATDDMGVPYMKVSESSYPGRDSFASNIANISDDLSIAKEMIPSTFKKVTRISKTTISAIQARVALYSQDWDKAIAYATEVIESKPLASKSDFPLIWVDQSESEVVWRLARVTGDSHTGASFFRQTGEIALYVPSSKILQKFDTINDIRYDAYVSYVPERKNSNSRNSSYLIKKYDGNNPSEPGLTDVKLFRTGEMYLIRAEAYAKKNILSDAIDDLNALRNQRIIGYTPQNYSSKEVLVQAIYDERFKELAFEGHRFFDLKREKRDIKRWEEDLISSVEKLKLTSEDAQYNFPIPADEMAVNEKMVQNPNY